MPTYDYLHPNGRVEERFVKHEEKDNQTDSEGRSLKRLSHFRDIQFQVPARFHVTYSDIYGAPGTPSREQHHADMKSGKTVAVNRWV